MAMPQTFEFASFDSIPEEELPDRPPEPEITEADVEEVRRAGIKLGVQQGFEAGEKQAREELEKLFAQAAQDNDTVVEKFFQQLADQFEVLFEQHQIEVEYYARQVLQMSKVLWQRLMPKYVAAHGCDEVLAVVEECLRTLCDERKIVVEYAADSAGQMQELLAPLERLYEGRRKLEFRPDASMGATDVRLSWRGGYAERNFAETMSLVEGVIDGAISDFDAQKARDQALTTHV